MAKLCVFDLETSISKGPHSGTFRDPSNDFFTVIAGNHPENIKVIHNPTGFNRNLPAEVVSLIDSSDYIIGHNLPFDLSYIWHTETLQNFLKKGGQVWDCFPPDVEILTEVGFVKFGELQKNQLVAQYNKDGYIELVKPLAYINNNYNGKLLSLIKDRYINHLSTPTHNRVLRTFKHKKLRLEPANSKTSLFSHHNTLVAGLHDTSNIKYSDAELCFMVALQADAYIDIKNNSINFEFKKQRKVERLISILTKLGLKYKLYSYRNTIIHVKGGFKYVDLVFNKHFKLIDPFELSLDQKQLFIKELQHWDGRKVSNNCIEYYNTNQDALDKCQIIAALSGCRTHRTQTRLSIVLGKDYTCQQNMRKEEVEYTGTVHCVTVPSGMIVIRNNGCVQISGNCQIAEYLMSGQRHAFASLAELQLIYLDEKVKEDRISKLFSKKHGADEIINRRNSTKRPCPKLFKLFDKYCHDDGATTLRIALEQIKQAKQLGMLPIIKVYNMYMLGLVNTMTTGIKVDLQRTEKTLQAFRLKSLEYLTRSEEITKKYWLDERLPPFNVLSPAHKSALLFGGNIKCRIKEDDGFYKNGNPKTKIVEHMVPVKGFELPLELTSPSEVKGRYKTGADIVDKIYQYSTDPTVILYCKLQRASMNMEKMCSTYLEPFLNLSIDGFLYPQYNNCATATGRLSSSKPNLQNIPSKGGMEKYIKSQFIAPEGYICCSFDYSQLEIYIQAMVTNDQTLTNDLLSGIDFHILRLSYAEDITYDEAYKLCKIDKLPEWILKRTKAKTISYQKAYGAAPKKLAQSTGLDEAVIRKIFEKEDLSYPCVKEFNDAVTNEIINSSVLSCSKNIPRFRKGHTKYSKRFIGGIELLPIMKDRLNADYYEEEFRHVGYHKSITGKCYCFEEVANYDKNGRIRRGFSPTQIKNYPQQGGAADVVALATAEIFKFIIADEEKNALLINQVHDSIEFYIKKSTLNLTIKKIKSIMEDVPFLFKKYLGITAPFKFKVDAKVGKNFYELEDYLL